MEIKLPKLILKVQRIVQSDHTLLSTSTLLSVSRKKMKTFRGHKGDVHCALLTSSCSSSCMPSMPSIPSTSSDHLLFTSGYDQIIRIWNPQSGHLLGSLTGHHSIIKSLSFCIYSSTSSSYLPSTTSSSSLSRAAEFTSYLISGSWDHTIKIWNLSSKQCQHTLFGHNNRVKIVISFVLYDLIYILSGSDDCRILFWSYDPNANHSDLLISYEGHVQPILSLALSNSIYQKKYLASGGADQTIRIWDLNYSPNSTSSVSSSRLILTGHRGAVNFLIFSALDDTKQLFSCSDDATIMIWDYESGYIMRQLVGHQSGITAITTLFRDDNEYILSVSHDATLRIWNSKSTKELKKIDCHTTRISLFSISLSEDIAGTKIAISGTDGYLRLIPRLEDLYLGISMSGIGLRVESHFSEATSSISKVQFIPKTRVLKNMVVGGFDRLNSSEYEQSSDSSNLLPKITSQKVLQGGKYLKGSDKTRHGKKKTEHGESKASSPIDDDLHSSRSNISYSSSPNSVKSNPHLPDPNEAKGFKTLLNKPVSQGNSTSNLSPIKPFQTRTHLQTLKEDIRVPPTLIDDEIDPDDSVVQLQLPLGNISATTSSPTLLTKISSGPTNSSLQNNSLRQLQYIANDGRAYLKSAGSISPSSTPSHANHPPCHHSHLQRSAKSNTSQQKKSTKLSQSSRKKEFILTVSMYSEPTMVTPENQMFRVLSYGTGAG